MIVMLVASCDLLKTRDSETPDGGNSANPPATSPQMVIDNLTSSFANKNVNDYDKLFADTGSVKKEYIFVPTQKAAGNYSALFSHWTRDSELNYFRKAMASVSVAFTPTVSFSGTMPLTNFQADSALYSADYSFFLSPTTYLGRARFYMIPNKNTGTWAIYRWEDLPSAKDTASWSDMKGQFSQ
jgi:hypothetical protein